MKLEADGVVVELAAGQLSPLDRVLAFLDPYVERPCGPSAFRQALPVDTMTTTELADVLARLEEVGISVEIDAGLLTPHPGKMNLHEVKPATGPSRHSERTTTAHDRLTTLASSIKAARENSNRPGGPAQPYAKMSGTIFVVAAVLLLVLLTLVVWRLT